METIGDIFKRMLQSELELRPSSERLQRIVKRLEALEAMSPEERRQADEERVRAQCEAYNRMPGHLKDGYKMNTIQGEDTIIQGDGYDCKLCLNRGDTMYYRETPTGFYPYSVTCKCMDIRKSIWRMRKSGLEKCIREYTFRRFEVKEDWQQKMLDLAKRYLSDGVTQGRWLYIGGQPGCGKSHICTAVAGKLLYEMPVIYAVWPQVSTKLKAIVKEADEYRQAVGELQQIECLYIDDFLKPFTKEDGTRKPPTTADMRLAFEILNYRSINKLPTILSSEYFINELADIDEATASRIAEQCGEFAMMVGRDRARNQRFNACAVV